MDLSPFFSLIPFLLQRAPQCDRSPDFSDQLFHPTLHLFIYGVSKIISLPSRIWNVPEHDLATFLQVTWPPLLLRNDDGKIGCVNHFRDELLPFFFGNVYPELSS